MPDCSSLEAAYIAAEAAEAVAAATWAVEQAEADLAYNDMVDATTAKWSAWMALWYCQMGFGGGLRVQASNDAASEARASARELRIQNIERLKSHRDAVVKRFETLKAAK